MISGKAMVCGVIGNPVGHSLSPMMHNYYGEALNLDYIYVPCNVDDDKVCEAIRGAYALGFEGINVTVPHKQQVMEHLLEIDDAARCIGAVNTLVRMEGGYKGYNTDADGLYRAIIGHGIDPEGKDCLMIGAGGAAKAVAYMLMKHGAASVVILNRNVDKAQTMENWRKNIIWLFRPPALACIRKWDMPPLRIQLFMRKSRRRWTLYTRQQRPGLWSWWKKQADGQLVVWTC